MPVFNFTKDPAPMVFDKCYGINKSLGETQAKFGETVRQDNWRLTQNSKPEKRPGHNTFIDFDNEKDCQGGWQGTIATKNVLITINNGNVYEYDLDTSTTTTDIDDLITEGTVTLLGTITDVKTTIYRFNDNIFFYNGTDWKYYNGTTYGDATDIAYVPVIAIETPPSGGGTDFEHVNLGTGYKWQWFVGDNSATTFTLRESSIGSATVIITIDGVSVVEGVGFTVNRTLGTIDFSAGSSPFGAPITDADVKIKWEKASSTNLGYVTGNKYAMDFGPGNDVSVFLFGHETYKNRRIWSGITYEGVFDGTYFGEFNFTDIGSSEFAITDITAQQTLQIIHTEKKAFYSYAEYIDATDTYDYTVYDLNESVGNVAYNGVQMINNSLVTLYKQSFWLWEKTDVEDERNANSFSSRIDIDLENLDFTTAITFDYQKKKELWVNIGNTVYIYNYNVDGFYYYQNVSATWFLDIDGMVYYGSNGTVEAFNGFNDNDVAVSAIGELAFADFGAPELVKSSMELYIQINPFTRTSLSVDYATNKFNAGTVKAITPVSYVTFDYGNIDYGDFSYATNTNPQTESRRIRADDYTSIKLIFKNEELDEEAVLLSLKLPVETQGNV